MLTSIGGLMPVGFLVVAAAAILGDLWSYRTGGGLMTRRGRSTTTSAGRLGAKVGSVFVRALIISSLAAAATSFFLSSQVLVGDPNVGLSYTLTSIAAAVLGGASLAGGRGSYVGAVIGAVFLTEIVVIVPFIGLHSSWAQMLIGALTLLALTFYQAPQILGRPADARAATTPQRPRGQRRRPRRRRSHDALGGMTAAAPTGAAGPWLRVRGRRYRVDPAELAATRGCTWRSSSGRCRSSGRRSWTSGSRSRRSS